MTRIARTRLGVAAVRKVGPKIDPTLIRLTGGRLSTVTPFPALLLTHIGAKSGIIRATTVVYFTDGPRVVVVASNFGAATRGCLLILDGGASPHDRCGQQNAAEEGQRVFVVAGGHSAPLLEPVEAAFNGVALLVDCGVEQGWAATG